MKEAQTIGQQLKNLSSGRFLKLNKINPTGSLEARKLSDGSIMFYWRYTFDQKTQRTPIGLYNPNNPPRSLTPIQGKYSILAAERAAEDMALMHHKNIHEGGGGFAEIERRKKAEIQIKKKQREQQQTYTVEHLLTLYCELLQQRGKVSYKDAQYLFKNHFITPFPKLAQLPANELTFDHAIHILRCVYETGKDRTANKLRSYLHAAFKTALRARMDMTIPQVFRNFHISTNPFAETVPNAMANRTDKNPLSVTEMKQYWQILNQTDTYAARLLQFHLLTGGLRIQQLVRLTHTDVKDDHFILHDLKGRRFAARPYHTPLTARTQSILNSLRAMGEPFVFSTDGGHTHVRNETLSRWAKELVGEQIDGFQLKRVRSGVETLLSSLDVRKDIRGQIQSHGINGVQDRSYDGFDYLPIKRQVLTLLEQTLTDAISSIR